MPTGSIDFILAITIVIIKSNKNLVLTNVLLGLVRTISINVITTIINNAIKTTF